ncbi:hypothetical protein VV869_17055 [Photobacterium sp. MCCC 1A19761]|uniref:hypothetical protein n=1 Tax=Photobacterium sp. MCCC 1A19761 TaxID=3115000 RepID=UPI00307EE302
MSEQMLKSSIATVQCGVARADGKLWVTESELQFEPHNQAFGLGPYRIERKSIAHVEKCLGKGGGFIPVTTDAIRITLSDGQVFEFILANPEQWLAVLRH